MPPILSNSWADRLPVYDVLIVGSGYGGAITAARIAEAPVNPKPTVCILERGAEWNVGSFPDAPETLANALYEPTLKPRGLFEFDAYSDIAILKGSGLGGTSLVNANVAIRPDPAIFNSWPQALRDAAQIPQGQAGSLWNFYERAEQTLGVSPHPNGLALKKVQALKKRADQIPAPVEILPIAVNFTQQNQTVYQSPAGSIVKNKCIDCGDCVTGCNVGAKNTLYMNYLPRAKAAGAHIFTTTRVDSLSPDPGGGWQVSARHLRDNGQWENAPIRARRVILAAGSTGSTEILLRTQKNGLPVSPTLGTRFSGNGDFFTVAYNGNFISDVVGWGNHKMTDALAQAGVTPGPSIVAIVRYEAGRPADRRFVFEDFSIPRAYRNGAAAAFGLAPGTNTPSANWFAQLGRWFRDWGTPSATGALNSSMLYLIMGLDDSGGRIALDSLDNVKITWPNAGRLPIFTDMNREGLEHAKALGARFVENPLWRFTPTRTLVTAHPLGGCPIGTDGADGTVDHLGGVFSGAGNAVHPGLYVADGATMRTSLGVNPFLTISALAERIAASIISTL